MLRSETKAFVWHTYCAAHYQGLKVILEVIGIALSMALEEIPRDTTYCMYCGSRVDYS